MVSHLMRIDIRKCENHHNDLLTVAQFFVSMSCPKIIGYFQFFTSNTHLKQFIILVSRSSLIFPLESLHVLSISISSVSLGKYLSTAQQS